MFIGDVTMWRSLVVGRITRNTTTAAKCATHNERCAFCSAPEDHPSNTADTGYPTNDHFSNDGRPTYAIRNASVTNPVSAITRNVPRITVSSGRVLIRMR